MFLLCIANTELSKIPNLSAAGENPEAIRYTVPSDAELLFWGKCLTASILPLDPEGHPTPAIFTRAAYIMANFPVMVVRTGSFLPPACPYIEIPSSPGSNPLEKPAVEEAKRIYSWAKALGDHLSSLDSLMVIGESVPGGTTSAFLVLKALGYDGMVSSASPNNPSNLKIKIWENCRKRYNITEGTFCNKGLDAVTLLGDPMQATVAGMAMGSFNKSRVILAGGTQMLAVAAVLRHEGYDGDIEIATTKYIALDKSAHFASLAENLRVKAHVVPMDLSGSAYKGLSDYEKGYVKEGVGAGGALWYANHLGVPTEVVVNAAEQIYANLLEGISS
ncbi:MAG: TIGR00303 family protein [Synergistaceae bacterium]|nr:TIGR00303 family protein [Synergistaceae bacterium]